jgi:putative acetyltransferase
MRTHSIIRETKKRIFGQMKDIKIRKEIFQDIDSIRAINEKAFGHPQEANIVDKLRANCDGLLSLVVLQDEKIIGHILFSPVTIEGSFGILKGMGLAPMAVLPELQRYGVGSELVKAGIEILRKSKCPFIIVLGHPEYYPRFGFERASLYGIKSQWQGVPDHAFMILWLDKTMMDHASGVARYRDEFNEAM